MAAWPASRPPGRWPSSASPTCSCSSAVRWPRGGPARRAASCAATTASRHWPPWPGTPCPCSRTSEELLGAPSGYIRTGYLVGVGTREPRISPGERVDAAEPRDRGRSDRRTTRRRRLWPEADLDDVAGFAYEPRGGYGDGHQTALAFAAAARRRGVRLSQDTAVTAIEVAHGRAVGVRLADGGRIGAAHVVLAAGPWSTPLAATAGVDLPLRAQRAQILLVDPGRPPAPRPVFSDLVSLQYVRTEGTTSILVGDSDHSDPQWADPDAYRERASDDELAASVPKFVRRFPGFDGASLSSSYAGCYDVTPDYNPVISSCPVEALWICAGFSRPRLQDLSVRRRAHGRSDHGRGKPARRRRPSGLPVGTFRGRGPDREPPPLRRRRTDAVSPRIDRTGRRRWVRTPRGA